MIYEQRQQLIINMTLRNISFLILHLYNTTTSQHFPSLDPSKLSRSANMPTAADPPRPWYWLLIKDQQDTNHDLLQLCQDQQKLLLHMEKMLDDKGISDILATRESSTTDAVHRIGPDSIPIQWMGGSEDSIPVTVDDIDLNGQVITQQMVKDWNTIFKLTSRIDGYEKSIDTEWFLREETADTLREAAGKGEDRPREKAHWVTLISEADQRINGILKPQMSQYIGELRKARNRIYCTTRHFFLKSGLLEPDDHLWKNTLFESESEFTKEHFGVPVYDEENCPFEQDQPDLWS